MEPNSSPVLLRTAQPICTFPEFGERRPAYVCYYARPWGALGEQEFSITHYFTGDIVPYHEHSVGVEVFLVDAGRAECWVRGKCAVIGRGDMIVIPPFTPHGFRYLEEDTVWREVFQQLRMNDRLMTQDRLRRTYRDGRRDKALIRDMLLREGTEFFSFRPKLTPASPADIPQIRRYDDALERFDHDGSSFLLKADRAETAGSFEFWQYRLVRGRRLSWPEENPHPLLFSVHSGQVHLTLAGNGAYTAGPGDALRIPTYCAGTIEVMEDAVLLDCGCKGHLRRSLEELHARDLPISGPESEAILIRNDCFLRFGR